MSSVLTFILAGGRGERLRPLTNSRAKPLLPFLGRHRLIDFTLFNCIRSGIFHVLALTCDDAISLDLSTPCSWRESQAKLLDHMDGKNWLESLKKPGYAGTADAVRQNLGEIFREVREVLILASDHVYEMDYREPLHFHRRKGALVTVAASEADWSEAGCLGILETDADDCVIQFQEKPLDTGDLRGSPKALASMGIYVFDADFLCAALRATDGSDFGKDLLPAVLDCRRVFAFLSQSRAPWKDVGTIDSYWETQIKTLKRGQQTRVPAGPGDEWFSGDWEEIVGQETQSGLAGMEDAEPIVRGRVSRCALSQGVVVGVGAEVSESILLEGAIVEDGARIRRAIVGRNAIVPAFSRIGFHRDKDKEDHFISEGGVAVLTSKRPTWT